MKATVQILMTAFPLICDMWSVCAQLWVQCEQQWVTPGALETKECAPQSTKTLHFEVLEHNTLQTNMVLIRIARGINSLF